MKNMKSTYFTTNTASFHLPQRISDPLAWKKDWDKNRDITLVYQDPATKKVSTFESGLIGYLNPTASVPPFHCYMSKKSPYAGYAFLRVLKTLFLFLLMENKPSSMANPQPYSANKNLSIYGKKKQQRVPCLHIF